MIVLVFVCCMLVREREKRKDKKSFKQDFLLLLKTNPTCLFSLTSTATHLFQTTRRGSEWGRWGNRTCRSGIEQKDSVHGGKPSGFRACHPVSRLFNGVFVLASCTSTTITGLWSCTESGSCQAVACTSTRTLLLLLLFLQHGWPWPTTVIMMT